MNQILDKIDAFLNAQKEEEAKLLFILPIILFGFLSYYSLYPITDKIQNNSETKNQQLKSKLSDVKASIQTLKTKNLKIQATLKQADKKLAKLQENKQTLTKLVNQLSFLKFDIDKWAKFYDKIPSVAKNNHITIIKLNNVLINQNKDLISKKLEIKIDGIGDFVNFVKFLFYFENQKELLKIKNIQLDQDNISITFDIYGVEL